MKPPRSLRADLTRAFWVFGGLLVLASVGVVTHLSIDQEDKTLTRQLQFELDEYLATHLEEIEPGVAPPRVTSRFMRAYVGHEGLPEALRERALELPEGVHEMDKGALQGEDYFLGVVTLPEGRGRLYVVYDVRRLDEWLGIERSGLLVLVVGAGVVCVLGLVAAAWISRRVLRPMTDLERTVSRYDDPERVAAELGQRRDPPELASLAGALERSMRRIDAFVHRERRFTRNASHELRTPVTVARGAVELLSNEDDPERRRELIGRVQRAVDQMEELIETFLWLARERESGSDAEWNSDLAEVVRDVVDQHRSLLAGRPVSIELDLERGAEVPAPPQAVSVVVSNLVKNAFQSTREGQVRLEVVAGRVRVVDSGPGPATERRAEGEQARGFGLSIVEELCARFGWRVSLIPGEGSGTVATVDFLPSGS